MLVALAAAAVMAEPEAEASPESYYYGYYGYPAYRGYYGWGGYYGYPYRYWKRDAEAAPTAAAAPAADADASPESWYYGYYGHPYRYWGYGYRGYYGYPYRYWWKRSAEEQQPDQMVKREAEEEEAKPAMLYAGYYGHYPTTLHYGVAGYPYAHHPYALAHPAVTYAAPVAPTVAVKPYTYYANSGGAVHIVKRDAEAKPEAEAEASPESWYYGYYGHPYRWGGYYGGWGGYYGRRWGYGYWG